MNPKSGSCQQLKLLPVGNAPSVPPAAMLALIEHFTVDGYKVKEGTANAADKKRAWKVAVDVLNAAAKKTG